MTFTQDVQLVGVVKENKLDVVLYDAAGKPRTFSCPPVSSDLRFSGHGDQDETSLTPCFTQEGHHLFNGKVQCLLCAMDTPHIHANTTDGELATLHPVPNASTEEEPQNGESPEQEEDNPAGENTPLLQSAKKKKSSPHYVYKIQVGEPSAVVFSKCLFSFLTRLSIVVV